MTNLDGPCRTVGRYVIAGAGAIGGAIGGQLHTAGRSVHLIAHGANLQALQSAGLRFATPRSVRHLRIPSSGDFAPAELTPQDVVVFAVKSQDTLPLAYQLADVAGPDIPVVAAQNGCENERTLARFFRNVYGLYVFVAASHLQPGQVSLHTDQGGILDIGRYPRGSDVVARAISEDLNEAGFDSRVAEDVMQWKYAKLTANLGNSLQALFGGQPEMGDLYDAARAEAQECFEAHGIVRPAPETEASRLQSLPPFAPVEGHEFPGGSSWQSIARGAGQESDYLNGEIVLLGRLAGVATPVNELLCVFMRRLANGGSPPGSASLAEFREALQRRPSYPRPNARRVNTRNA